TVLLAERIHRRYPILWEMTSRLWRSALDTFVLHDVAALVREGGRVVGLELATRASLPLRGGGTIQIRGRFDRVARRESGAVAVSDYKTSGRIAKHVDMAAA